MGKARKDMPDWQEGLWLLDLQTTGTSAENDFIVEVGWTRAFSLSELATENNHKSLIRSAVVQVPADAPNMASKMRRVKRLCGITSQEIDEGSKVESIWATIKKEIPVGTPCVIHYATFEKAFLPALTGELEFPYPIVCTHRISKKLLAELPSKSLRSVAGRLGYVSEELKRTTGHIEASLVVAAHLFPKLIEQEIGNTDALQSFLAVKAKKVAAPHTGTSSQIDKEHRLKLPSAPGVYRFSGPNNSTLYIGKANSLKTRVNSYFRGRKTKGSRLHEMLSQARNVSTLQVDHPIEASLVEAELIKEFDPPYNRALRAKEREVGHLKIHAFKNQKLKLQVITAEQVAKSPKLLSVHQDKKGQELIFGPFSSARALEEQLQLLRLCFPQFIKRSTKADTQILHEDHEVAFSKDCIKQAKLMLVEDFLEGIESTEEFFKRCVTFARASLLRKLQKERQRKIDARIAKELAKQGADEPETEELDVAEVDLDEALEDQVEWNEDPEICVSFALSSLRSLLRGAIRGQKLQHLANCQIALKSGSFPMENGLLNKKGQFQTEDEFLSKWNVPLAKKQNAMESFQFNLVSYDVTAALFSELQRAHSKGLPFTVTWKLNETNRAASGTSFLKPLHSLTVND